MQRISVNLTNDCVGYQLNYNNNLPPIKNKNYALQKPFETNLLTVTLSRIHNSSKNKTLAASNLIGVLDHSAINASELLKMNANNLIMERDEFLESSATELIELHFIKRLTIKRWRTLLRIMIQEFVELPKQDHFRNVIHDCSRMALITFS